MDPTATPQVHRNFPHWPSGSRSPTSRHFFTSSTGAAIDRPGSRSRNPSATPSIGSDAFVHDVLPGIPSRHWSPAPQSPTLSKPKKNRHKSIELYGPSARPLPSHEEAGAGQNTSRLRTRTLDEGKRTSGNFVAMEQPRSRGQSVQEPSRYGVWVAPMPGARSSGLPSPVLSGRKPSAGDWLADSRIDEEAAEVSPAPPSLAEYRASLRGARACRMQHLMNTLQGRIEGETWLRFPHATKWSLSYCAIDALSGSLLGEVFDGRAADEPVVSDLRGCNVRYCFNADEKTSFLHLQLNAPPYSLHLAPKAAGDIERWHAALLCWQDVRADQCLAVRSDALKLAPRDISTTLDAVVKTDPSQPKRSVPIIKTGKLDMLCDDDRGRNVASGKWTTVSCIIKKDGTLDIYTADDTILTSKLALGRLSRSAVQRVNCSVYGPYCIAIYPLESRAAKTNLRLRPLILRGENRVTFEAWFALFRAFAIPELYGPPQPPPVDILRSRETLPGLSADKLPSIFRVERTLELQVSDFRDARTEPSSSSDDTDGSYSRTIRAQNYHVQLIVDGQIRAKTKLTPVEREVTWYENLVVEDIPATTSYATFRLVQYGAGLQSDVNQDTRQGSDTEFHAQQQQLPEQAAEKTVGECTINILVLCGTRAVTKLSLCDDQGISVGTLTVRSFMEHDIVLMDDEYSLLSELLHLLSNSLTFDIAERTSTELAKFASALLNIYQVSGQSTDWLASLAEEEIDGLRKEKPPSQFIFRQKSPPNDARDLVSAYGPVGGRQDAVRGFNRHAAAEANNLFRGNTLISKALDLHMQRLGREYLEETLGKKLREVIEQDLDWEVDPGRMASPQRIPYNMGRLQNLCEEMWKLIYNSARACPPELQGIFRHIRACAQDRFGELLRNAPYAAVGGFIFLRFFCPAILNPGLFGLSKEALKSNVQRTLTLVAKCIQGLANQTSFGTKQPWMEPLNNFLLAHRQEFRDFIDSICTLSAPRPVPASYSAPVQMLTRLPPLAREGYPSLPYLIDSSRSFASLVRLWLDNNRYVPSEKQTDHDLLQFHNECQRIQQLAQDRVKRAERTDVQGGDFSEAWAEMARRMEATPVEFWDREPGHTHFAESSNGRRPKNQKEAANGFARSRALSHSATSSRPSMSPARVEEERALRGIGRLRFRSRSGSRGPGSRQSSRPGSSRLPREERSGTSEEEDERFRQNAASGKEIERPVTAEPSRRRLFKRRKSDR